MAAAENKVIFKADGVKDREVESITYDFNQATDMEGQVSSTVTGGKIYITVKSKEDGSTDLLEWMLDAHGSKNGSIDFPKRTTGANMKTLKFENGYCVAYQEHYDKSADAQAETFTISARKLSIGSAKHDNTWTDKN